MKKNLLIILLLLFSISACTVTKPQTESTNQAYPNQAYPNQAYPNQTPTQGQADIPLTEADVPRITVEDAKAAVDGSEAVIVDVRSAESFAAGHIAGAISIPLAEFETNISNITLEKDQWIITYCT
ncbi:MAG: rhodanese-like domain-containing protein [Anaerolineales bacterium]|nr:rhodanese-like domain-containing protein [Anaerolineales bacterium]